MYLAPQPGQPFRAGLVTRWVPAKGFRSSRPPFPSFAWRTHFRVSKSRRHGISSKCKAKYGGLEVSETRRLKALEDENRRLKRSCWRSGCWVTWRSRTCSEKRPKPAAQRLALRYFARICRLYLRHQPLDRIAQPFRRAAADRFVAVRELPSASVGENLSPTSGCRRGHRRHDYPAHRHLRLRQILGAWPR